MRDCRITSDHLGCAISPQSTAVRLTKSHELTRHGRRRISRQAIRLGPPSIHLEALLASAFRQAASCLSFAVISFESVKISVDNAGDGTNEGGVVEGRYGEECPFYLYRFSRWSSQTHSKEVSIAFSPSGETTAKLVASNNSARTTCIHRGFWV
jgi:hypothetical protein